jgi:hypothetical protein
MTPCKEEGQHYVLEFLYNKKHKWGCSIIENVFGIFQKKFQELLSKSDFNISI